MRRLLLTVGMWLALSLTTISCSLFTRGTTPTPLPDDRPAIATAVQATVDALQGKPVVPAVETPRLLEKTTFPISTPTESVESASVPQVVPQALYFLAPDSQGIDQVWRLAPDAIHFAALTAETSAVTDFDVSRTGKLAYVTQNQLIVNDPQKIERTVIADGGPDDRTDAFNFTKKIERPAWSPDGNTLAYAQNGINLLQTGATSGVQVLPNQLEDMNGYLMPRELYLPDQWSPDGTRLLIDVGFYEGSSLAVFEVASKTLTPLSKGAQGGASCCSASWAPDGQSIFSAGFVYGSSSADLWRYDAASGKGAQLIPETAPDGSYNYTDWPLLLPTGKLVYFFTNQTSIPAEDRSLLVQMTSSGADGVTGRVSLREEPVHISEVLWAPDGSLAVVVLPAPGSTDYPAHGSIGILYPDERPLAQVIRDGRRLRWGP